MLALGSVQSSLLLVVSQRSLMVLIVLFLSVL